jgi:hypothetical protein
MTLNEFERLEEKDRAEAWNLLSENERERILEERRSRGTTDDTLPLPRARTDEDKAEDSVRGKSGENKQPENGTTKFQGFVIIFLLLVGLGMPFFSTLRPVQQWEYMIESPSDYSFSTTMDRYGREGWELVFARRATDSSGHPSYECIFKRPKKWSLP